MCRVLDQLSGDYAGKVTVEKVNLIENRDIARKYNVKFVPHLLFLDEKGNVVKEKVGGVSIDEALAIFREAGVEI
jgi:thioredoxin 1